MLRGTCRYIYHNVMTIRGGDKIIELFPHNCSFSYTKGFLYKVKFDSGVMYLNEYDFHRYFEIEMLAKDDVQ